MLTRFNACRHLAAICGAAALVACGGGDSATAPKDDTPPTGTYGLTLARDAIVLPQSGKSSIMIHLTRNDGNTSAVTLVASGLPSGVTAAFNPPSASRGDSVKLTLTATASASTGSSTVQVSSSAFGLPNQAASFSLATTPPSISLAGLWAHDREGARFEPNLAGTITMTRNTSCDDEEFTCYTGLPTLNSGVPQTTSWTFAIHSTEVLVCLGSCGIAACIGSITDSQAFSADCYFLSLFLGTFTASRLSTAPVATVTMSPTSTSIVEGSTAQLTATLRDASGVSIAGRTIVWTSSNPAVASVSGTGLVTGNAAGAPVTITATCEGKSATASVTVTAVPVSSVTVTPSNSAIVVGGSAQLTAMLRDAGNNIVTGRAISWTSSNVAIASVSTAGLVLGVAAGGPVTITATSEGKTGTATVSVSVTPVNTVTLTPTIASIAVGGTTQLTATLRDAANNLLTGRSIAWTSSNTGVASVTTSGLVTGVAAGGPVTITATSEGRSATASVTVTSIASVPVATVTVAPANPSISVGATTQLDATLRDAANNVLTGRTIGWTTSNAAIASVSTTGLVTGVAVGGPVTITATSEGKSGTATVTVASTAGACLNPVTLTIGQPVNSSLAPGDCVQPNGALNDFWRFTLTAQTTIQIDMTSSAFDTYLLVYNLTTGSILATDHHGLGGNNSRITTSLPAGQYGVIAEAWLPGASGTYTLSVTSTGAPPPAAQISTHPTALSTEWARDIKSGVFTFVLR